MQLAFDWPFHSMTTDMLQLAWKGAVPLTTACVYPLVVYTLARHQKGSLRTSEPISDDASRWPVVVHNVLLCIASIIMCLGTLLCIALEYPYSTMEDLFCFSVGEPVMPSSLSIWLDLFYWSKYWELLDTVLLVMRGKPLTFLHVYHHAVVIPETWIMTQDKLPWTLGCVVGNTGVHIIMYLYFALRADGRSVSWRRLVTRVQLVQFMTAVPCVPIWCWYHFTSATGCSGVRTFLLLGVFDGSLLLLFLGFYRRAYQGGGAKEKLQRKGNRAQ